MKQITTNEILTFSKLLQMETNALAVAKASINVVSDEQLSTMTKSSITAAEARIAGLNQFISENQVTQIAVEQEGVH